MDKIVQIPLILPRGLVTPRWGPRVTMGEKILLPIRPVNGLSYTQQIYIETFVNSVEKKKKRMALNNKLFKT